MKKCPSLIALIGKARRGRGPIAASSPWGLTSLSPRSSSDREDKAATDCEALGLNTPTDSLHSLLTDFLAQIYQSSAR